MEPVRTFRRSGLSFDVRDVGPADGPAVVCLHGFPQDGTAFDAVAALLAAAGLRVLAPDQRGYSPGARPRGRRPYVLAELAADVVALLDAAGVERAHVVGHDWGGAVGWRLAARHADRTASLTALSTPHPRAVVHSVVRSDQALRSAYMAGFQLPWLPERMLLADGGARLRRALGSSGLDAARADHYVARMLEPGALTSALAWYRALPLRDRPPGGPASAPGRVPVPVPVPVPVTLLHGTRDPFFSPVAVRATGRYVRGPLRVVGVDTGHWLPEEAPEAVAEAVLRTVGGPGPSGR